MRCSNSRNFSSVHSSHPTQCHPIPLKAARWGVRYLIGPPRCRGTSVVCRIAGVVTALHSSIFRCGLAPESAEGCGAGSRASSFTKPQASALSSAFCTRRGKLPGAMQPVGVADSGVDREPRAQPTPCRGTQSAMTAQCCGCWCMRGTHRASSLCFVRGSPLVAEAVAVCAVFGCGKARSSS